MSKTKRLKTVLALVVGTSICMVLFFTGIVPAYAQINQQVSLTEEELQYIEQRGPVRMVVDPDWYPYEMIDEKSGHRGIAADLIALIAERTGLEFQLVDTEDWQESLDLAYTGQVDMVSLLNKTDERSQWLIFTEPYFIDPNVLITREEHEYIFQLERLAGETVVLPKGTSVEERLRQDYPNLKIIIVESEDDALAYVEGKKADMTLRSLTMAAHVINEGGYFNLKIAGEVEEYSNFLRMGITKEDAVLQGILNKGIGTISEQEIQNAINNHISIKVMKGFDYQLFFVIFGIFAILLGSSVFWLSRIRRLNKCLEQRQEELMKSEQKYRETAIMLESKNLQLEEIASVDDLTGLLNRHSFNQRIKEEMERASRYGTELSILLIDLDHFKRINDTYGHDAGDQVLCKMAETLLNATRKVDWVVRWGGEEFVVLLPSIGLADAVLVGEKLRREAELLLHLEKETVTISIGASSWTRLELIESWFKRTDKALYQAKQEGRNRVRASDGGERA